MALRLLKCKVVDADVDWITCTAATKDAQEQLWNVGQHVLHRNELEGEHATRWHANGYEGWTNGSVSLGARPDGCILRISGEQARYEWRECFRAAENVSRLDLAVDCELDCPVTSVSRDIYRNVRHVRPPNGRPPTRRLIVSGDGGSTAYIGSRVSEQFGRVYDKGIESKSAAAGKWWRFEVEYKGSQAFAHSQRLTSTDDHRVLCCATVASWFRARANYSYSSASVTLSILRSKERTTDERKLSWLASAVRPTAQYLVERYGVDRVLAALGFPPQSAVEPARPSTTDKECA